MFTTRQTGAQGASRGRGARGRPHAAAAIRGLLAIGLVVAALAWPAAAAADDSIGQATPIALGFASAVNAAEITPQGDVDFYTFAATAGRTYVIETFNIPAAGGFAYPLGIQVLNANGSVLADDANGQGGSGNVDARVVFTAPTTAAFYVRVASAQGWTGIYSLRALPKFDEPGAGWDQADDAEPNDVAELAYALGVGLGQAQTHELVDNSDYEANRPDADFYRFSAAGGRTYVIELLDLPDAPGYAYPIGLTVLNANGSQLAEDEYGQDGSGNVDARVIFRPAASGTYFIRVGSTQSWVGPYTIRILPKYDEPGAAWGADSEPNDVAELAYALGLGGERAQTHQVADASGLETNRPDVDFYRFDGQAGVAYVIETFNLSDTSGFAYPHGIQVLNANGSVLADDANGQGGSGDVDARVTFTPAASGTYFIRAATAQGWEGQYSIRACVGSCTFTVHLPLLRR